MTYEELHPRYSERFFQRVEAAVKYPIATILQWWTMQPETLRRSVLGGIPNCTSYNLVNAWNLLPLAAKLKIEKAYGKSIRGGTPMNHTHATRAEERVCEAQAEELANAPRFTAAQIEKYIAAGGVICPACGSDDIGGASIAIEAGCAFQNVSCNVCDAEWTDEYKLTGITEAQ
jgi:hypothetical protein